MLDIIKLSELPVKAEEITGLTLTAPETLQANNQSLINAMKASETLLYVARENGMNRELDSHMNEYQIKLRKTISVMNERRKPVTQLLDKIKKAFTTLESEATSIDTTIQEFRDKFAGELAEAARKSEEERLAKIQLERERGEYVSLVEQGAYRHFYKYLSDTEQWIVNAFENVTLETIDRLPLTLETISEEYPQTHFAPYANQLLPAITLSQDEKVTIYRAVMNRKFSDFQLQFTEEVKEQKQWVLDRLAGKRIELQRISEAKGAEQVRLQKEAEERQARERERMEAEKLAAEERQRKEAESARDASLVQTLFDTAEDVEDTSGIREGYKIVIKTPAAYLLIASYWFEREGVKLPADKIEKTTFGQMKAFAEKQASKDEKEQLKSPHLAYEAIYKAKITRAK
jgi:hypothetical protein